MMNEPLELKDAKGYRSKYINSLNDAVKQTRIVGGDAVPVETEAGTLLRIPQRGLQSRFRLFSANIYDGSSLVARCAVSDGCFFVAGRLIKLQNGLGTAYKASGLLPRGSGWYSTNQPASWATCDAVILSYDGEYIFGFRYDNAELYTLIEDGTASDEPLISIVAHIGTFSGSGIMQNVSSDIYYGGEGAAPEVPEKKPWDVFSTMDDGVQIWWVVRPEWYLAAPYDAYPDGASMPMPEASVAWETLFPAEMAREIDGKLCWMMSDVLAGAHPGGSGNLYAVLDYLGQPQLWGEEADTDTITEGPTCIYLGRFTTSSSGAVSFVQSRSGAFRSFWYETEPFFVTTDCGQMVNRLPAAPTGLAEGTQMSQFSFWVMETYLESELLFRGEQLNFRGEADYHYPQQALKYGDWIWRYNLHYSLADNALVRDEVTTAVSRVAVSLFASVIEQPFVERVQVVYPTTPLEQGSVDAVGSRINVLAVSVQSGTDTANLFKTESIDTTQGNIIEVTQ